MKLYSNTIFMIGSLLLAGCAPDLEGLFAATGTVPSTGSTTSAPATSSNPSGHPGSVHPSVVATTAFGGGGGSGTGGNGTGGSDPNADAGTPDASPDADPSSDAGTADASPDPDAGTDAGMTTDAGDPDAASSMDAGPDAPPTIVGLGLSCDNQTTICQAGLACVPTAPSGMDFMCKAQCQPTNPNACPGSQCVSPDGVLFFCE